MLDNAKANLNLLKRVRELEPWVDPKVHKISWKDEDGLRPTLTLSIA